MPILLQLSMQGQVPHNYQQLQMNLNYGKQNPFSRRQLIRPANPLYWSHVTVPAYPRAMLDSGQGSRVQHYPLNIWNFHEDHSRQFSTRFGVRGFTQYSSFEKSMITAGASSKRQDRNSRNPNRITDSNPFLRKSLLVCHQSVGDELQRDLNMLSYRQYPRLYGGQDEDHQQQNIGQNHSIMMDLLNESSNKKRSSKFEEDERDGTEEPKLEQPSMSAKREEHKGHYNYKDRITIRGREFYRTKVFGKGT